MSSEQVTEAKGSTSPYKHRLDLIMSSCVSDLGSKEDQGISDEDSLKQGKDVLVLQYCDDKDMESVRDLKCMTTPKKSVNKSAGNKRKRSSINVVENSVDTGVGNFPSNTLNSSLSPFSASLTISEGSFFDRCSKRGYFTRSASKEQKGTCPICQEVMNTYQLETHAAHCNSFPGKENIPTEEVFQEVGKILKSSSPGASKSLSMELFPIFNSEYDANKHGNDDEQEDEKEDTATNTVGSVGCVFEDILVYETTETNRVQVNVGKSFGIDDNEDSCGKNAIVKAETVRNIDEDLEENFTTQTKPIDVDVRMKSGVVKDIVNNLIDKMLSSVDEEVAHIAEKEVDTDMDKSLGSCGTYEAEADLANNVGTKEHFATLVKQGRKRESLQSFIRSSEAWSVVSSLEKQREKLGTSTSKDGFVEKNIEMMENLGKVSSVGLFHNGCMEVEWRYMGALGNCLELKEVDATEEVELEETSVGICPMCSEQMQMSVLEAHAADCQG